jgi:hypothetical protein
MSQKGTDGTNGTDGTDVGTVITTQGDILYRDGSGLQRLGAGTSGQFLKTQGTGANPVWGTVASKILGYKINVNNQAINMGNVNQNALIVTQLNTTYGSPVSTNSYFLVKVQLSATQFGNHGRAFFEFSVDGGSTWSYAWSNGSDANVSRSGHGLTFNSDIQYQYPQIPIDYTGGDDNVCTSSVGFSVYQPTRPHSVSDFRIRVKVFTASGTNNFYINRTESNSGTYGSVFSSSVEITEIEA